MEFFSIQKYQSLSPFNIAKARTLYRHPFIFSCLNSESFSIWIYWVKHKLNLAQMRSLFLTKIGLRNQCCFHLYFDRYFWSSFEYKKMVRELSKIVHEFTEAEQFVFISEQSSQFFVKFSTKYLQHRLKKNGGKFKSRLV